MIRSLVTFALIIFAFYGRSQFYQFQVYGNESGLNDPFVYSMVQDPRGYLLVGTGEGLGVFDGISFNMKYQADGLAENFVSKLYRSKTGIVWAGHKEGGVSYSTAGRIQSYDLDKPINSIITGISEDETGAAWFSSQNDGIFCVDIRSGMQVFFSKQFEEKTVNDIKVISDKEILVATNNGVELYNLSESGMEIFFTKRFLEGKNVTSIQTDRRNGFYAGTNQSGLFYIPSVTSPPEVIDLPEEVIIKNVSTDDQGNVYVSSHNAGVFKIDPDDRRLVHYTELNGLPTTAIQTTFVDREGTMWLGAYGMGVFKHTREVFTYYLRSAQNPIAAVEVSDATMYVASGNKVLRLRGRNFGMIDTLTLDQAQLITCLFVDRDKTLWVGTSNNGLFFYEPSVATFKPFRLTTDNLGNTINAIEGHAGKLWIGTYNGLYEIDVDGNLQHYDISSGLSHNTINCLFYDADTQTLYLGSESSQLSTVRNGEVSGYSYSESNGLINVYHIDKLSDGAIYLASYGDGVFRFRDNKFEQFTTTEGLASNFCYGLVEDGKKKLWVTHNGALSRINPETATIRVFDREHGANKAFLRSSLVRDGNDIWYGSEDGLLRYNGMTDVVNLVPPVVGIASIKIDGDQRTVSEKIELPPGKYDFIIQMRGLALKRPKEVQFSYWLENYDDDWSDISTVNEIKFSNLTDGVYSLHVMAYNDDMQASEDEVYLQIVISTPYWKRLWFWVLVFLLLLAGGYWYVKFREKQYLARQEELETELAIRTKEVREQKEVLEATNKDITDSINYAKRIQDAVLPEDSTFQDLLPGSFVVYLPRDIVSGDFYWINRRGDETLVVCGDCTGHGVPGAFLSLIGQQLLREIFDIKAITEPAEIITELDRSIIYMMHRQQDDFATKDGMDLVVCSINHKTNILKWSSAVRPLVMYRDGKREFLRGTRMSVGGGRKGRVFEQHEIAVQKDDMFYMFSDGYPDQFGGPHRKKLKIAGLFAILDEVQSMPLGDQEKILRERILEWKGTLSQTDDILIMGIRI